MSPFEGASRVDAGSCETPSGAYDKDGMSLSAQLARCYAEGTALLSSQATDDPADLNAAIEALALAERRCSDLLAG